MIRTSKAPVPFTLPWRDGEVVFHLRAADIIERADFEAALSGMGAGRVFDFQLSEAREAGINHILADQPDDAAQVLAAYAAQAAGDKMSGSDQALVDEAEAALLKHWPAYKLLTEQAARRFELVPVLACQWFCTGWEGPDLPPYAKGMDGKVTLDCLLGVPSMLIRLAGMQAYQMLYTVGAEKNSVALSPPAESPPPSRSGKRAKAG